MQIRYVNSKFACREEDDQMKVEGYFAVFDDIYDMGNGFTESIDPHAFDDAINDDVRALIDHETRLVLGRTTAKTLALSIDGHGLWGSIDINREDTDAMNLRARTKRGDVNQGSFGFDILEEVFTPDGKGGGHWRVLKVKLYEVSCVTFPAYKSTALSARSEDIQDMRKRSLAAWKESIERKMKHA